MNVSGEREAYFSYTQNHKKEHLCTGVPYDHGDVLNLLVKATESKHILEIGTGIGYTTYCLVAGNEKVSVETIDQDLAHLELAKKKWKELGVEQQIIDYWGKAEDIVPILSKEYDMVFFDANTPQKKFLTDFRRLLHVNGLLITTNLFLKDSKGGRYLQELSSNPHWRTGVFSDTALSVRVS